jgi:hypothetical protein
MVVPLIVDFFQDFRRKLNLDCHSPILSESSFSSNPQFVPVLGIVNNTHTCLICLANHGARAIVHIYPTGSAICDRGNYKEHFSGAGDNLIS